VPAATTADFYEVRSVRAVRSGDSATLIVDRTVKRDVPMSYAVRVFQVDDRGAHLVCAADHGPYMYRPDALLPSPNRARATPREKRLSRGPIAWVFSRHSFLEVPS
jgi:hypothetical protein